MRSELNRLVAPVLKLAGNLRSRKNLEGDFLKILLKALSISRPFYLLIRWYRVCLLMSAPAFFVKFDFAIWNDKKFESLMIKGWFIVKEFFFFRLKWTLWIGFIVNTLISLWGVVFMIFYILIFMRFVNHFLRISSWKIF